MNKAIQRRDLAGVQSSSNPFAGGVAGVLLVLCLWLVLAVLTVSSASGGTAAAWGRNDFGQTS